MTDIVERMEEHAEWHHRNGDEYTASMIRKAADEIERLRREAARLREALHGLMVGCEYRTCTLDGIAFTGWQTKRMPDDKALDRARAALAKETSHD